MSQLKRNPFKRTPAGLAKTVKNPLSHLTDKAIGYNDSQQDSEVQSVCDSESDGIHVLSHSPTPTEENNANKAVNTHKKMSLLLILFDFFFIFVIRQHNK